MKQASLSSRILAKKIAAFADDKKALDVVVLDMRQLVNFCDFFVLCSGNTERQVKAIADGIDEGLAEYGMKIGSKNNVKQADWIVFDAGDVVVHIFQKDKREFYNLEYLWKDAKEVAWQTKED